MAARQRIVPVRREYNQWVGNQTLEDYALRFTAEGARRWSAARIANTALGSISFLALEAIGAAITISVGFTNAMWAIAVVGAIIFLTALPITYYAARDGVDIDLLTRGAGFGYIGSTITSLIYASFTFIFFAIEAAIMAQALELCFDLPLSLGYIVSALVIIPLVTHGVTFISRFQLWTQPLWIVLHLTPFVFIAAQSLQPVRDWMQFEPTGTVPAGQFNLILFGMAASVVFSLIAQVGEQVDFLRFLPSKRRIGPFAWWTSMLAAGPGWIVLGAAKLMAGSFLAFLVLQQGFSAEKAAEPAHMYLVAFGYVIPGHSAALVLTGVFLVVSQLKINVTNAYAGSLAWSNFFSRLTHSHPGRVVWLVFNVAIALVLMELGIYKALEQILALYSNVAVAWVGALVADLVINKPLGLSPPHIEFKRAHLYDFNPVGVGAMLLASTLAILAFSGVFGEPLQHLAPFIALGTAFVAAPLIALVTHGRYYLARATVERTKRICCICELPFERHDMAFCPAYSGTICSLCCSLDARCHDCCKTNARFTDQLLSFFVSILPAWASRHINSRLAHYIALMLLLGAAVGLTLAVIFYQQALDPSVNREAMYSAMWKLFFVLMIIAGVAAWLLILAQESRQVAQEEMLRQTALLNEEIEAHRRTDAMLQKAKEVAEAANQAKSRYVIGISHELRTPLNAIYGYAQLLERDQSIPEARRDAIRTVRRSAQHLSGLIEGLLDISRIEAGRLQLQRDPIRLREFLDQLVGMFRMQAEAKALEFRHGIEGPLPAVVYADEKRLRQVLINLLSNAMKFTERGHVSFTITYRNEVAVFGIADTGIGVLPEDMERIFEPFVRGRQIATARTPGIGLGLTITKLLTEIMGGELTFTSEADQGTKARVKLLLSRAPDQAVTVPHERRIFGYKGLPRTLIVADDNAAHRDLMQDILAPLGFVLFTAADGVSCLTLAGQCEPDLILLDIAMPGLTGWEVARRLREGGQMRTAVLMLSANVGDFRKGAFLNDFHDAVLAKPFEVQQLLDSIQSLLKLEWVYEAAGASDAVSTASSAVARIDHLAPADITELQRLGRMGHVKAIEAKLDEIHSVRPSAAAFTVRLRGHVRDFDFRSYMAALEEINRHDP